MDWVLNKHNKVPLYLQLKDMIKYSISTGGLKHNQRLPTVHGLAQNLQVNFDTVRKAYKDLEREGLVSTERGVGTFVTNHAVAKLRAEIKPEHGSPRETLTRSVHDLLREGRSGAEITEMVGAAVSQFSSDLKPNLVLFAECNTRQAREISTMLRDFLKVEVRPVLLTELNAAIAREQRQGSQGISVVTTGFHMKEVRQIIGDRNIPVDFVVANMSPETRRQLDSYPKTARFGFVCRDPESKNFYSEVLRAELGLKTAIRACLIHETAKLKPLLQHLDVLLVAPSVYDTVSEMVPPGLPIFNIQDRVDPMSLRVLRESLSAAAGRL